MDYISFSGNGYRRSGRAGSGRALARSALALTLAALAASCAGHRADGTEGEGVRERTAAVIAGTRSDDEKLENIFRFVQDGIEFNWVYPQDLPAEEVLLKGRGVCMQKANLFSAMAREAGFATRFRFMYVRKQALEDFLPGYAYEHWADPFPHTVVEVERSGRWVSFDPTFDTKLYELCRARKLNFAKYPEIDERISFRFDPEGVKGAQEFWAVPDRESFYGDDLSPLMQFENERVAFFKRALKPLIFSQAKRIMDGIRGR